MEKSFEGITKKEFNGVFIIEDEIFIMYDETSDLNEESSISFPNYIRVEDNEENRKSIENTFDLKYCCVKYNKNGEKCIVKGFFKDYEEFYEYLDEE